MAFRSAFLMSGLLIITLLTGCDLNSSARRESFPQDQVPAKHQVTLGLAPDDAASFVTPAVFSEEANPSNSQDNPSEKPATDSPQLPAATSTSSKAAASKNSIQSVANSPPMPDPESQSGSPQTQTKDKDAVNKPLDQVTVDDQKEFRPPFVERTDLFSPPKSGSGDSGTDQPAQEAAIPTLDVTLKGFARVRDQRVLLLIADTLTAIGVGQEKLGIRVVEINPPKVTLAREQQQWTLSLASPLLNITESETQRPQ